MIQNSNWFSPKTISHPLFHWFPKSIGKNYNLYLFIQLKSTHNISSVLARVMWVLMLVSRTCLMSILIRTGITDFVLRTSDHDWQLYVNSKQIWMRIWSCQRQLGFTLFITTLLKIYKFAKHIMNTRFGYM